MAMFTIGDKTFLSRKLNAEDQWHCFRRLAPLVKGYKAIQAELLSGGEGKADPLKGLDVPTMLAAAGPLADAIAAIPDKDSDFVMHKCLDHTGIKQGEMFAPLRTEAGMMFSDLTMYELLMICWHVLRESLGSFFADLSSSFGARGPTAQNTSP